MFAVSLVCFLIFKIPTSFSRYLSNAYSFHKSNGYVRILPICKVLWKSLYLYLNSCSQSATVIERLAYMPYKLFFEVLAVLIQPTSIRAYKTD
jgi:hypothetical protein